MQTWMPPTGSILLAIGIALAGCTSEEEYHPVEDREVVNEPAHHHDHGPHGGHLIELGEEEYHAEVVFEEDSKAITVYLLGSDSEQKQAIPSDGAGLVLDLTIDGKQQQFTPTAQPQDDDPEGRSSRFVLADDSTIAEHVADEEDLQGRVSVTISGRKYEGTISHDHGEREEGEHSDDDHADEP